MIITCPHCRTRYQVASDAIGAVGRKVQCAHCQRAWQAAPIVPEHDDRLFDEDAERELDAEFAAEARRAEIAPVPAPPPLAEPPQAVAAQAMAQAMRNQVDPALAQKRERAFFRRQTRMGRQLPLARVRRTVRLVSLAILALVLAAVIGFRTSLVRQFPDLAGVYAAVGLGVNVVGLDFRNVHTVRSLKGGAEVLRVEATIYSVSNRAAQVPSVVVTLLDKGGEPLYEWSVSPAARDLEPGESVDFSTELPHPPKGAESVRLTFAGAHGQIGTSSEEAAADRATQ
jgi:predicted Zn finger-like uncharacterized protein